MKQTTANKVIRMTLGQEELALFQSHPKMKTSYDFRSNEWHCDLMVETRMYGPYSFITGCGADRLEAFRDARRRLDEHAAETDRHRAVHLQRVANEKSETASREKALDDAIFDIIPARPRDLAVGPTSTQAGS
ncbi:hypothetical protein G6L37_01880 [Agrobacterium rubi]|nr:hypothetical protein [Agrobacterium rubi]NTF24142.1 hypothetical protein [Agrobacterium rubi]